MKLGLSSITTRAQTKRQGVARVWTDIGGLQGHWDFSDNSTVLTLGGNPVSNGGTIGTVTNKVTGNLRMGNFLYYKGNPTFNTGGANGKSYMDLDGNDAISCFSQTSSTNTGAVEAYTTCRGELSMVGHTVFAVVHPDSADVGATEVIFHLRAGTSINDSHGSSLSIEASEDEYRIKVGNPTDNNEDLKDTNIDIAAAPTLLTVSYSGNDVSNAGKFYVNGDQSSPYAIDLTDIEQGAAADLVFTTDGIPMASVQGSGQAGYGAFCVGSRLASNGPVTFNSCFNGRVYEVLLYLNAVGDSDRALIEAYLKTKYGI